MHLHPPTCVGFRYGPHMLSRGDFLVGVDSALSLALVRWIPPPETTMSMGGPAYPSASLQAYICRFGNINPIPISYALLPRLRGRLTLGRLP